VSPSPALLLVGARASSAPSEMALSASRCTLVAVALLGALASAGWSFVQPPPFNSDQPTGPRLTKWKHVSEVARRANMPAEPATAAASSSWRLALAACVALLVAFTPMDGAQAARSGGRMGGMGGGMRSAPQQRYQQQAQAGPRFSTGPNVSIGFGPMIAPPLFAPPMFGSPFFGMGLFGPPVVPVPVPSLGPSMSDQILQDQQRREERQMDTQKAQIDALQKEIADLKAKRQ